MIRHLLLAVLFSAAVSAKEPKRGETVVRFLADRVAADLGQVVLVADDQRSEPLDLPVSHLSAPVTAPAHSFAVRAVAGDAALAEVKLPDAGKSFIVLLLSAATGFTPVVISSDDPAFKPGDVRFQNATDKPIVGSVGSVKFQLDPGKGQFVRPAGALPEKVYEVVFSVREEGGDRLLGTPRWPVENHMRSYVFFFVNPATGRTDYRAVDEFVGNPAGR